MKFRLLKQCVLQIMQIVMIGLLSFLLINNITLSGANNVSLNTFIRQGLLSFYSADEMGNTYFDFVKVVSILGLFSISFYSTISLSSDLADGARSIIKGHSNRRIQYEVRLIKLITIRYIKEYVTMIAAVISTYFIVCNFECDTASVLLTCVELFLLEWILFSISQLISKNALIVLIYSFAIFLLQGMLLLNPIIALLICITLFFISVSTLGVQLRKDES